MYLNAALLCEEEEEDTTMHYTNNIHEYKSNYVIHQAVSVYLCESNADLVH